MAWRAWAEELFRHDEWNIGVVEAPISAFLDPGFRPRVAWLPRPARNTFRADPFGWQGPNGVELLCEHFDGRLGRGRIVKLDRHGGLEEVAGFPAELHQSFPAWFEFEGSRYLVPEMFAGGEVRLYRATNFPLDWRLDATLLPVAGVDCTLFRFENDWWLMGVIREGHQNPESDLYLWHAPDLRGPWRAHARNPVKRDRSAARPAGSPFWHQGALYRPAQDCSRRYGGALALCRITRLSPEEFAEEVVARHAPLPEWRWNQGLHTLTAAGDCTLLDACRTTLMPALFRRALRRQARSLLRPRRPA